MCTNEGTDSLIDVSSHDLIVAIKRGNLVGFSKGREVEYIVHEVVDRGSHGEGRLSDMNDLSGILPNCVYAQ